MPVNNPTGTAIAVAIAMMMIVPRMPFPTPPPGTPTGWGSCVRKSQLIAADALHDDVAENRQQRARRKHRAKERERDSHRSECPPSPEAAILQCGNRHVEPRTLQIMNRANALTTTLTTKRINPSSISALM